MDLSSSLLHSVSKNWLQFRRSQIKGFNAIFFILITLFSNHLNLNAYDQTRNNAWFLSSELKFICMYIILYLHCLKYAWWATIIWILQHAVLYTVWLVLLVFHHLYWFSLVFPFRLFSIWLVTAQKFKNPLIYTRGHPRVNQKIKKYIRSANFFLIWVLIFYIVLVPVYLQTSFNL